MSKAEIELKLKDIFKLAVSNPEIDVDSITGDTNLNTDLGLTSIGVLYMVIAVEEFFAISFDDVSFGDFKTVNDVVEYIYGKKN
ncbi:MAG: acyl carrier protein [Ruminococcaceae bacterium]|nr:acyl carrier protein [Oscillospiraceae bacterium]